MRTYDENQLLSRLTALNRRSKTAFAASCAERLLPVFERYASFVGDLGLRARLGTVVEVAWDAASGAVRDVRAYQARAEAMVPSDEDDWALETGYGQSAAAAAAYAIRTWLTDDPQEAAWAARQVYEVADCVVLQSHPELDLNAPGSEAEVLATDFVQEALAALDRALMVVEAEPSSWQGLRADAEAEGRAWADGLP